MAVAMMEQEEQEGQEAGAGSLALAVKVRMEAFMAEVTGLSLSHPVQRANAELYVRGCWRRARVSRLSRWSSGWMAMGTIRACSSSWPIVRGSRSG